MGIGDWGLGIGDWGLGPIPNPQSPIPNPQSPLKAKIIFLHIKLFNNFKFTFKSINCLIIFLLSLCKIKSFHHY